MARPDELNIPSPGMASPNPSYRVPRRKTVADTNTRRMLYVAGGLAGGLAVLMGVWSLATPRRGGVPVVQADSRPIREKPANPGGMTVDGNDAMILSGASGDVAKVAPPPETPDVAALREQAAAAAAAAARAAPKPVVQAAAQPAPPPAQPPREAPVAHAIPAVARMAPKPEPVRQAAARPEPARPEPARPEPARPEPARPAMAGRAQVQLAAVSSESAARSEWQRLEHKMPELLGGRKPALEKYEHGGHVFWRVRTGGFADTAQASEFCTRVRSKGAGCTVASF